MNYEVALLFVFAWGLLVRLSIMYHIDPLSNYQHDIFWGGFGHWDYIKYFAQHFTLPNHYNGEAYQPPVHYIILGIFYRIAELLRLNIPYFVQCVVLYMNFLLFIVMQKLIKLHTKNNGAIFWGMLIFIFFPANIIYALALNNDSTLLFFSTIALYYLFLWFKQKTYKNVALLGLFSSLAFLSKVNAAMIAVTLLIVVIIYIIVNRHEIKMLLKQAGVYIAAFAPLILLYCVHLARIKQNLFFDYPYNSLGNTFKDFFNFNIVELVKQPLSGNSLFEYLYKTSMFDEYGQYLHAYVLPLARVLSALGLVVMAIWLFLFIKNILKEKSKIHTYILPIFYLITMVTMFIRRYQSPATWNQHFRFIIPVLVVYGASVAWGYEKVNNKYVRIGINVVFALFAISSFAYYVILAD